MRERGRDVGPIAGLRSKKTCRWVQNTTTTLWLSTKKIFRQPITCLTSYLQRDKQLIYSHNPCHTVAFFASIIHLKLHSTKQTRIYSTLLMTRYTVHEICGPGIGDLLFDETREILVKARNRICQDSFNSAANCDHPPQLTTWHTT